MGPRLRAEESSHFSVVPAQAGIHPKIGHVLNCKMDPRLRAEESSHFSVIPAKAGIHPKIGHCAKLKDGSPPARG